MPNFAGKMPEGIRNADMVRLWDGWSKRPNKPAYLILSGYSFSYRKIFNDQD